MEKSEKQRPVLVAVITAMGVIIAALLSAGYFKDNSADKKAEAFESRIHALEEQIESKDLEIKRLQELARQAKPSPEGARKDRGTTVSNPPTHGDDLVKTVDGFQFDLQKCERQAPDVYCSFMITNLKADRRILIDFRSRMIDSSGESHRQCARIYGGRTSGGDYLIAELPNAVPSRFQLKFCGVANIVDKIALLEMKTNDFSVEWRDVGMT